MYQQIHIFVLNGTHCTTILINRIDLCGTQNGTQTPFLNNKNKKPL